MDDIAKLLQEAEVRPNLKGFAFMHDVLEMLLSEDNGIYTVSDICKCYSAIGEKCGCDWKTVSRAVQSAADKAVVYLKKSGQVPDDLSWIMRRDIVKPSEFISSLLWTLKGRREQ